MVNKKTVDSSVLVRWAIIGVLTAGLGTALFLYLRQEPTRPQLPAATAEAKAYVKFLKITEPELKQVESYMAIAKIYEITGKITNTGDRNVSAADLTCIFYDPYGQVVLRERVPLVKASTGGLKAGQTKDFRLPFESIPESWNRSMPSIVIAHIAFGS